VIPARGGSKRIPRKNARVIAGKPLIRWVLDAAIEADVFDHVVVSTDDIEIAEIAIQAGATVPGLRPKDLASDTTPSLDVMLHVLADYPNCSTGALLQPTSPLIEAADIVESMGLFVSRGLDSMVSVSPAKISPNTLFALLDDGSQRIQAVCVQSAGGGEPSKDRWVTLNGAIYLFRKEWLGSGRKFVDDATVAFVMPPERSVDVDVEEDWLLAEALLKRRQGR